MATKNASPRFLIRVKRVVLRWALRLAILFVVLMTGIIAGLTHHAPINFTFALKWEGAK
jgi:hypothetical protein